MPNGKVKVHIAPLGRRKRPCSGPAFSNDAQLQGELMSKAKQKSIGAVFSERAKVAYASESSLLYWCASAKQAQDLSAGNKRSLDQISGGNGDAAGDEAGWIDDEWNDGLLDMEVQVSGEGFETEHFEEYIGS
jgi:hypothetical protein